MKHLYILLLTTVLSINVSFAADDYNTDYDNAAKGGKACLTAEKTTEKYKQEETFNPDDLLPTYTEIGNEEKEIKKLKELAKVESDQARKAALYHQRVGKSRI